MIKARLGIQLHPFQQLKWYMTLVLIIIINIICGKTGYVATKGGLLISYDWGDTWENVLDHNIISLGVDSENKIYAATSLDGVFFMTEDMGLTWDSVYFGMNDLWSLTINHDDYVYVGCEEFYNLYGGVYASSDNGQSWDAENNGLSNLRVS